jgi:serine/threonine protein kinase
MPEDRSSQHVGEQAGAQGGGTDRTSAAETETFPGKEPSHVSDVVLAESVTAAAPSFRMPAPLPAARREPPDIGGQLPAKRPPRDERPMALLPGARVDDYEIVRLLGRGAFGHVYLAKQVSLDRLVALKISANRGSEGRTMARLEHQHIVQVFAEKVDRDFNQRLLCMQLVPGIGLDKLIGLLHVAQHEKRCQEPFSSLQTTDSPRSDQRSVPDSFSALPPEWNGAEMLAIIDHSAALPAALDPSALHDREALGRMDAVEATAWLGGRLAEALDFAHRHGVLHRDIKPANILVNPYGRPMLADFNISSQPIGSDASGDEMFGGTFAYMAPEHLDAFNPSHPAGHDVVTARSDMYSLGLVLQQLLEGQIRFPLPARKADLVETLDDMAVDRRRGRPACRPGPPGARKTLERTIARCLEPEPKDRFASGAELAEQLDGCRRVRQAERQLPPLPKMFAPIAHRPLVWLIILVVLPQVAGSIVNIAYNATQIGSELTPSQQRLFAQLVIGYNAIVYPLAIGLFVWSVRPVWKGWRALAGTEPLDDGKVEAARRQALRLPLRIAALTALGWFPGGILFPLLIHLFDPTLGPRLWAHFFVSFFMSGLIALAYSLCGAQYVVLRLLYPSMWRNVRSFGDTVRRELEPMTARLGYIQFLASSIPLLAAIFMLVLGDTSNASFRLLVTGLIFLGMAGLWVASAVIRELSEVVVALTSTKG